MERRRCALGETKPSSAVLGAWGPDWSRLINGNVSALEVPTKYSWKDEAERACTGCYGNPQYVQGPELGKACG